MTFENVECVPGIGDKEGEVSFVDSLMGIMKNTEGLGIDGGIEGQSRGREDKRYKSRTWRSGGQDGKRQGFLAALENLTVHPGCPGQLGVVWLLHVRVP